jgi:hypothetical protein
MWGQRQSFAAILEIGERFERLALVTQTLVTQTLVTQRGIGCESA